MKLVNLECLTCLKIPSKWMLPLSPVPFLSVLPILSSRVSLPCLSWYPGSFRELMSVSGQSSLLWVTNRPPSVMSSLARPGWGLMSWWICLLRSTWGPLLEKSSISHPSFDRFAWGFVGTSSLLSQIYFSTSENMVFLLNLCGLSTREFEYLIFQTIHVSEWF